jgi:hypothetical protein
MPSYSYDFRKTEKDTKKLDHIRIYPASAEAPDKHVVKHYFAERPNPDVYEFRKEDGPELIRHLQLSIGIADIGKTEGERTKTENAG